MFHKGFARARDRRGWHHVDTAGQPLYEQRFRNVEPFYNGQARVERHDGSLAVIGEGWNATLLQLRGPSRTTLEELSGDMVGAWKTQVIRAAVELGVFEMLPASAADLDSALRLAPSGGSRLLRALLELDLVARDAADVYHVTERGDHLRAGHDLSLAAAAEHWGGLSYEAWRGLADALRTGNPVVAEEREDFFRRLADCPGGTGGLPPDLRGLCQARLRRVGPGLGLRGSRIPGRRGRQHRRVGFRPAADVSPSEGHGVRPS